MLSKLIDGPFKLKGSAYLPSTKRYTVNKFDLFLKAYDLFCFILFDSLEVVITQFVSFKTELCCKVEILTKMAFFLRNPETKCHRGDSIMMSQLQVAHPGQIHLKNIISLLIFVMHYLELTN